MIRDERNPWVQKFNFYIYEIDIFGQIITCKIKRTFIFIHIKIKKSFQNHNSIVTNIACISHFQSHKTILSPFSTKRILNYPIIACHSNEKNSVIKNIFVILAIIKNPRLIVIPSISIKTNNKRSGSQCIRKIGASCNITMSRNKKVTISFKAKSS